MGGGQGERRFWQRPPPYKQGDKSADNLQWFTMKSARSLSWNYLLALVMCSSGKLILKEPMPHLMQAAFYAKLVSGGGAADAASDAKPAATDIDVDMSFDGADGFHDAPSGPSLSCKQNLVAKPRPRKVKIEPIPEGEASDYEDPDFIFDGDGPDTDGPPDPPPLPPPDAPPESPPPPPPSALGSSTTYGGSSSSGGASGSAGAPAAPAVMAASSSAKPSAQKGKKKLHHPKSFRWGPGAIDDWAPFVFRPPKGKQLARYEVTCPCAWHIEEKVKPNGEKHCTECTNTLSFDAAVPESEMLLVRRLKMWILEGPDLPSKRRHQRHAKALTVADTELLGDKELEEKLAAFDPSKGSGAPAKKVPRTDDDSASSSAPSSSSSSSS